MVLYANVVFVTLLVVLIGLASAADVCLMVYQMADNNLESFLRDDNTELVESNGIGEESLTTWIYFDGRDNSRINSPLETLFLPDGSRPNRKYTGSQYLHYDHSTDRLTIQEQLGELNSDNPQTVADFVIHALTDCVSKGSTEYVMVFSSHGTGFAGYGGDDNSRQRRTRRKLLQSNENIVRALEFALESVEGTPTQLDVIGFDACLMSSLVAVAEYSSMAKYFLASEATEPGHGWAYRELTATAAQSALGTAQNIHTNFLQERQGYSHQAPKTMSLVETAAFDEFHMSWEFLAAELEALLEARDDLDFYAYLYRARSSVVSFESYLDDPGRTRNPSAVDIGSFLSVLSRLCRPVAGSSLAAALDDTQSKYDAMFIKRGIGPGTPDATGMHIMWPERSVYRSNRGTFDYYLLEDSDVVSNAPNWFSFVESYLAARKPTLSDNVGQTCFSSTVPNAGSVATIDSELGTITIEEEPEEQVDLLLQPSIQDNANSLMFQTELNQTTDQVSTKVGIDSSALYTRRRLARLQHIRVPSAPSDPRSLQDDRSDYMYIWLGSAAVTYNSSSFSASWDRLFLFLGDENDDVLPVFMYNDGGDARSVPVIYFPPETPITREDIPIGTTLDAAIKKGGVSGSLKFGYNSQMRELTTAFTLFTNDASSTNSSISETPKSALGQIVPILFVEGRVDGFDYDVLLGGFDRSIFDWSPSSTITVQMVSAQNYLNAIPSVNTLLVEVTAQDTDDADNILTETVIFRVESSSAAVSMQRTSSYCSAMLAGLTVFLLSTSFSR